MVILNKKGQLEIGITMMVLIVFLLLLIIALVVYFKFSYVTIKETRQEIMDEKFSSLVNAITGLPEIKCSIRNVEKECLDAKKLVAFGQVMGSNPGDIKGKYYEDFGIDKLEVNVVYPGQGIVCNGGNYADNCNFRLFSLRGDFLDTGMKYTTPVSLYYPDENKYKIGKLEITANIN